MATETRQAQCGPGEEAIPQGPAVRGASVSHHCMPLHHSRNPGWEVPTPNYNTEGLVASRGSTRGAAMG